MSKEPVSPLANERLKLTPFLAERHADSYFAQTAAHPKLYAHMPLGPFESKADFVSQFLDGMIGQKPGWAAFAIIDKTRPASAEDDEGELAGMISFINTSDTHLFTEIGGVLIFPKYQRTHVNTNAVGLMLQRALGSPQEGGMGLRRVQWLANSMNAPSIRVAERFGFRHEAVLRWHYVFVDGLKKGKVGNGRPLPPGSPEGSLGRDSVVLSLCWDDWQEGGAREKVEGLMARKK
ncbi:acetyltransferase [Podospora didyma]|uniref:Acetyltransferase n=1 Tax=Podospora didyma TaxID=330526 RepID=A0AAE0U0C9_9PEZI|nr:acetyltransferase [Podospora didyma]